MSKVSKHSSLPATTSKQTSQKSSVLNDSATCIPDNAGISVVAGRHSSFLLRLYTMLAAFALASFVLNWHLRVQYFGLAALFPGGGWVGIGGWWILAFVFNLWVKIALPLSYSKLMTNVI